MATVVALLPVVVTVAARAGRDYLPTADLAVIDLRVRDVWSTDVPLVGAYSRFGWNHPGPLMSWLIAPLSLVTGRAAWATLVGSALLQGVAIGLTAFVAWKVGRLPLLLGALAVQALAYAGTGTWMLLEPWNPHAAYPYLPLFVLLVWAVGLGRVGMLVGAALAGTFLVQTHVGYAPLVAFGGVWIAVCAFDDIRRDRSRRSHWLRSTAIALAVVVLTWLPPLVEQWTSDEGNITRLWRYFALNQGTESALGVRRGAGIFAAEFRWLPPWLGGTSATDPLLRQALPVSLWWLVVPGALVGIGLFAAARARNRPAQHAVLVSAALGVVGVFSLARVRGTTEAYLFYWRMPLAVMLVASTVAAVGAWLRVLDRWRGIALAALFVVVTVPSLALAVDIAGEPRDQRFTPTVRAVIEELERNGLPTDTVLERNAGSALLGLEGALVDDLDRRGVPIRVDEHRDFQFGDHRTARLDEAGEVWYVAENGALTSLLISLPDARVLASTTPLSPAEEDELRSLQQDVAAQLDTAGRHDLISRLDSSLAALALGDLPGVDPDAVARIAQLNQVVEASGECRCSVVAFPPAAAPVDPLFG